MASIPQQPLPPSPLPAGPGGGWLSAGLNWLGAAVFASLLAAIIYLFYLGGYRHLLVDESASFVTELTMRILDANQDARLLVIGNSTVAEGFRASVYNRATAPRTALNLGVASAHFFAYEKLLDLALRRGLAPRAILLVLTPEVLSRRPGYDEVHNDISLMKTELALSDYGRLWSHSDSPRSFAEHAGQVAARPSLFTTDVKDLLVHWRPRIQKIRLTYGWMKTAGKDPEALETDNRFQVCDAGPLRELEQAIATERATSGSTRLADLERVWAGYSVRVHQPLAVDAHQHQRLQHLLEYFASRVDKVYVAAAPYYDPEYDSYPAEYRAAFANALSETAAAVKSVTLIPDFSSDCTMFFDTVHLNHPGGEKFTTYLQQQIGQLN